MDAISQRCRPKHQVLVLKCYPRAAKGAVDVKPNSSELSYLLFYATSRRSKIQKIGSFLEKKTVSDVWRMRIGNVQVTLQILAALIEKAPKDLPLFAPYVLNILDQILRSNDITLVESSLPTFEAFCDHHDASSLFADQTYLRQYETIVQTYATFASTCQSPGKGQPSKPVSMRWRNTGLEAIRSVASTDPLSSASGRQYDVIVSMILENLWTDNEDFLDVLLDRAQTEEKSESDKLLRRRTSVATVRTTDTSGDANPMAFSGSALDADKLEEEDIGVLAVQCLKQIFVVPNRSQIYAATNALLKFVEERVNQDENVLKTNTRTGRDGGWAIKMFSLVARWAPVQDRYVILVTTLETLTKLPLKEDNLQQHIVLVAMMASLLRSDINLIGLSIMDVLLGLIKHMRKLIHLPGELPQTAETEPQPPASGQEGTEHGSQQKELLTRINQCVGDLATHVYYADQISDMLSAILLRLKPGRSGSTATSSPGEKADGAVGTNPSAANSTEEHPSLDALFTLTVGKISALRAIKSILLVANPRTKLAGNVNLSRNRVPIQVWEGTQWLLRDPDGRVRKAYADAIITWLDRETTGADLKARDAKTDAARPTTRGGRELPPVSMARRAASSASERNKAAKAPRSNFVPLLHVAIYDNALQFVDYETDMCLLHVLLTKLVFKLGINAVRHGLPMIFRLQEDIQDVETPVAKVRVGSLCHGYFWTLTEKFDCDASVVGRAIHNEIIRRRSKNFWVEGVSVPPPMLELVGTPGMARPQRNMPLQEIESEALLPFDDRSSLVEAVCNGYQETTTISPAGSPAGSPGRTFVHPILGSTLSTVAPVETDTEVPSHFREQMLADWSREAVLAAVQAGSKSESLNGSKAGTTATHRARLAVNGGLGNSLGDPPSIYGSQNNLRPVSQPAGGPPANPKPRQASVRSKVTGSPASTSSRGFVTSVDQLKMVLSGHLQAPGMRSASNDDSSDSLVSYDMTVSDLSFNPPAKSDGTEVSMRSRSKSRERKQNTGDSQGPLNSNPIHEDGADADETVPPVPPVPAGHEGQVAAVARQDHALRPSTAKRNIKSRGGESRPSPNFSFEEGGPVMDLQALLKGIDSSSRDHAIGKVVKPPY